MGIPIEIVHQISLKLSKELPATIRVICAPECEEDIILYRPTKGCNKIALGHHFDDAIETILLNIFTAEHINA